MFAIISPPLINHYPGLAEDTKTGAVVAIKKQRYPAAEAARELAFAKVLASNPSVLE